MSNYFIAVVLILSTSNAVAVEPFIGHYSTVTESECNYEIVFLPNDIGIFLATCRREDGSHIDDIQKQNFTWKRNGDTVTASIDGGDRYFEYKSSLSCGSFGNKGATEGLEGYGMQFWRVPIKCE
jgi:hypothetical protein